MGLNKATQIKVFLFVCSFFFLTKIANRRSTNLRPNIWEKNLFEKKWWWQCRFKKGQILVVIELPWKMCLIKLTRANDIGQVLIVWGDGTRLCHLALKVFGVTRVLLAPGTAFYKPVTYRSRANVPASPWSDTQR